MTIVFRLLGLALLSVGPVMAQDRPPLSEVGRITEGLIETAIAYEIGERCEPIDGRRLQGIAFLLSLNAHARSLGYSAQEIEAYIDNEEEKDRLEAIARQRLRDMGAVEGQPDTYCAVGREEIGRNSQIGKLLAD